MRYTVFDWVGDAKAEMAKLELSHQQVLGDEEAMWAVARSAHQAGLNVLVTKETLYLDTKRFSQR